MEKSDKQRKPVAIKNLAELKRFIQPGVEFKTLSQKNHPDLVGLTRVVTTVQTVCFYSKIKDQPNSRFSTDMHGWDVPGADPSAYQQTEPQMGGMNLG